VLRCDTRLVVGPPLPASDVTLAAAKAPAPISKARPRVPVVLRRGLRDGSLDTTTASAICWWS
jgi:hypothetical protein